MKSSHEVAHAELVRVIRWSDDNLRGLELPVDERSAIAAGCLDLVLELQASIAVLYEAQHFGSMMSLMRVINEALVRGLWIRGCADDPQLQRFKKGDPRRKFGEMIEDIELALNANPLLSMLKNSTWNAYNSLTHVGYLHVTRRHRGGALEANYPDAELRHSQYVAGVMGLLAASTLASMAGRMDLCDRVLERSQEFLKRNVVTA